MKSLTKLASLFVFILFLQSCEKEDFNDGLGIDPGSELVDDRFKSENFGDAVTGNFFGVVTSQSGENLEGVQITIGNSMSTTDRNGVFIMNNVNVFENFAYIKAQKTGYIDGSRVVIPKTTGVNRIEITLLDKETTATINSGQLSEVSLSNGSKVSFAGDFVTADGNEYNGQVDVVLHYLPPNRPNTFAEMPGSLFAQTETNSARTLETYGMVSVNLFSSSGQPLNIDEDSPATIEFPVDYTQIGTAPDTIALWYFDEANGYWKEDGEATRVGDKYVAEVTHFSWWNCDLPLDYVNLCFSLSPANSTAATPYRVYMTRKINNQIIFSGIVSSGEELECGLIPKDEEVNIYVYGIAGSCFGQLSHEEVVGGFSTDTVIDISFTEQQISNTNITGTVTNCAGTPLTNGYLFIDFANTFSITDGIIDIGIQHCQDETVNIQVFDSDTDQWTVVSNVTLDGTTLDIGNLSTCDDTGGIYNGNIRLSNQTEVNNFGQFGYSIINGILTIGGSYDNPSTITNLSPLSTLKSVEGRLNIIYNEALQNLDGLNNVTFINLLYITSNQSLTSISSLSNLVDLRSITISNNNSLSSLVGLEGVESTSIRIYQSNSLTSLAGLESITSLGALRLGYNENLTSISELSNVTTAISVDISYSPLLPSLEGLNQITSLDFLRITGNDSLEDLSELSNLTSVDYTFIGGNNSLTNLSGLENLVNTKGLVIGVDFETDITVIAPNQNLVDFCALENLFNNGTYVDPFVSIFSGVLIENNAYNPTIQDIINGNCKL